MLSENNFAESLCKIAAVQGTEQTLKSVIGALLKVSQEKFPEIVAAILQESTDENRDFFITTLQPFVLKYLDKYPEKKSNFLEMLQEYPALLVAMEEKVSTQNPDVSLTFGWQASQKSDQITHHDDDQSQKHQQKAFTP